MNKTMVTIAAFLLFSAGAVAQQTKTVVADEAPFEMAPLEMHVFPARDFSITRYGAKPDDVKANTAAFAKAFAACSKAGGGRVVVPDGTWLTGPIHFLSGVELHLADGARILFDDDPQLYLPAVKTSWEGMECYNYSPLIYAYECENVAISGAGTIEAKMDLWRTWFDRPEGHMAALKRLYSMMSSGVDIEFRHMEADTTAHLRPHLIQFNRCTNVRMEGFKIRHSPFWTIHTYMCRDLYVNGLDVYAHGHNNDGIDLESTQHAVIENCRFDQGDDGVVIKSGRNQDGWKNAMPTSDIVVRNCDAVDAHGLLVVGSEIAGGVSRVYIHDCTSSSIVNRLMYLKTNERRGGVLEDITMENVEANVQRNALFCIETDVVYQWKVVPTFEVKPTVIRNITMRNVHAKKTPVMIRIMGDGRCPVDGVRIENASADTVTSAVSELNNARNVVMDGISYGTIITK